MGCSIWRRTRAERVVRRVWASAVEVAAEEEEREEREEVEVVVVEESKRRWSM